MAVKLLATIANLASEGRNYTGFRGTQISDLVIDATYSSDIKYSNTVTDNPVERSPNAAVGSYISDHVYNNPTTIDLECAILNTPIGIVSNITSVTDIFSGNIRENISNRLRGKSRNQVAAYELLTDLQAQGTIFTVVSYNDVIDNLVIEDLSFPRDADTGDRLFFNISLKQLRFSQALTVNIPQISSSVNDLVSDTVNLGTQTTSNLTPTEVDAYVSGLAKFFGV